MKEYQTPAAALLRLTAAEVCTASADDVTWPEDWDDQDPATNQ